MWGCQGCQGRCGRLTIQDSWSCKLAMKDFQPFSNWYSHANMHLEDHSRPFPALTALEFVVLGPAVSTPCPGPAEWKSARGLRKGLSLYLEMLCSTWVSLGIQSSLGSWRSRGSVGDRVAELRCPPTPEAACGGGENLSEQAEACGLWPCVEQVVHLSESQFPHL